MAEVRTLAYFSKCKFFMDCYAEGKDIYVTIAQVVNPGEEMSFYWSQRPIYKQVLLGKMYGMGDEKLANMTDQTPEEAEERDKAMFDLIPEVSELIQDLSEYCVEHGGECKSFLGDKMVMTGKRYDQLSRLGINQPIQGFTAVALADGFYNNIYQSYKTGEIKIRPVNVVHDSSQNYFETKKIFELTDFYTRNMRQYLRDKYEVDWDFEVEVGVNYFDMVGIKNMDDKTLSLKADYTSLYRLLKKLQEDGLEYRLTSITKDDEELLGEPLVGFQPDNLPADFQPDIPDSALKQSISKGQIYARFEFDKSKYKAVIEKI